MPTVRDEKWDGNEETVDVDDDVEGEFGHGAHESEWKMKVRNRGLDALRRGNMGRSDYVGRSTCGARIWQ